MATGEISDDDFFDSPSSKTNETKQSNLAKKDNNSSSNGGSSGTLSAAKPPTHPNSAAKKARRAEGSDSEEEESARSPRSSRSGSTVDSKRVIHAKVPTAELDDEYEEGDEYGSQDLDSSSSDEEEDSGRRTPSTPTVDKKNDEWEKYSAKRNSASGSNPSKENDGKCENSKTISTARKTSSSSYLTDDDSESDTDSDVTEVSPLNSPKRPSAGSYNKVRRVSDPTKPAKQDRKPGRVDNDRVLRADKDAMDFKILLQAVLDIENEGPMTRGRQQKINELFPGGGGDFSRPRKNYSFTNDRITTIDRENQRLLENIVRKAREAKKAKEEMKMRRRKSLSSSLLPRRPSSSAINRCRQQQKIEAENLAILKRLQGTRPSKELQRDVLIDEYKKHLVFSGIIPLSSLQTSSWKRTNESFNVRRSRPQSAAQSAKCGAASTSLKCRAQSAGARKRSAGDYFDDGR